METCGRDAGLRDAEIGQEEGDGLEVMVEPRSAWSGVAGRTAPTDGPVDQPLGQLGRFPVGHGPADGVAVEDVQDHVEVEVGPLGRPVQLRDVPRPELVGGRRQQLRDGMVRVAELVTSFSVLPVLGQNAVEGPSPSRGIALRPEVARRSGLLKDSRRIEARGTWRGSRSAPRARSGEARGGLERFSSVRRPDRRTPSGIPSARHAERTSRPAPGLGSPSRSSPVSGRGIERISDTFELDQRFRPVRPRPRACEFLRASAIFTSRASLTPALRPGAPPPGPSPPPHLAGVPPEDQVRAMSPSALRSAPTSPGCRQASTRRNTSSL